MSLPKITVANLKRSATDQSFARGESYFRSGAVTGLTLRQQTLHAEVEGNEARPYRVTVTFDAGGVTEARCSCPYSFEGWCKHIVATLLVCVHQPETIEARPSLSQLLEPLSLSQAKGLIQSLVTEAPALLESVDFYVSTLTQVGGSSAQKTSLKRKTNVDPAPYQRRVREIFREAVRGWEYGQDDDSIAYDMAGLMQDALAFAEQGDGPNALVLLKGITEACVQHWDIVDDFIGMSPIDFDIDFDSAWTEALLSTDLTEDEVLAWQEDIEAWQDSLGSFAMALEALRQGWDYPPLQRVFQGEITAQGAWTGEPPDWANEFSQIRLKILERQERYEDYLRLAEAEGQTQEYLTMLGRLGRVEQAMSVAQEQIVTLQEAKALAETLRAQKRLQEALQIAMQGLRLEQDNENRYVTFEFASWTRDLAEGLGDRTAALEASLSGFKAKPSLKEYQTIEDLSGEGWPATKTQLLQQLRKMDMWHEAEAQIDILLHENLVDDAVKKVSDFSSYRHWLILRVMDAAIASHSQWVIENAVSRAESIMDEGKAKYYNTAVEWLKRAKAAYLALDQEKDWLRYRRQLADTHGRKRKLMGLFEQNRL
ncbi:MAG: SWIM zinc finger family protein [Leptolyngbyaceae cyanobacterium MO_188.B28]|nr:SWIM zinc finger family protein [Leptolyngbyaceae cyanobacterium MO_188.B28]